MLRFRVFAAGVAVALLAVSTVAAPAAAHDELLASSPSAGEALTTAPTTVSLQFSADVMTIGAVVVIADADDNDWAAGEVRFEFNTVTVDVLPDMPDAGYELRWRVVSSDGHPIAGVVPFTVGDAEPLVREAAASAGAAAAPPTVQGQAEHENGVVRSVLIGAGGAAIAVALLAVIRFFLRRRQQPSGSGPSDD